MRWTKRHSRNAVAAKERKRQEQAGDPPTEMRRKIRRPRTSARFWLCFRDRKIGDSLTLALTELPWRGRFVTRDGQQLSTRAICAALAEILNHEFQ